VKEGVYGGFWISRKSLVTDTGLEQVLFESETGEFEVWWVFGCDYGFVLNFIIKKVLYFKLYLLVGKISKLV